MSKIVKERCKFCSGKGWTFEIWASCPKCCGYGYDRIKLMDQFLRENPMITDDEVPDKFEEWVTTK